MIEKKPVILCILDGWGEAELSPDNAIAAANTPNFDALRSSSAHSVINASEGFVGLPDGQMGNSEVGHMNIGAGRVIMQDLPRINEAIADGSFAKDAKLQKFIEKLKDSGGKAHLLGLLSDGGVHAHIEHIVETVDVLRAAGIEVCFHAFLDGRDTPPKSALKYVAQLGFEPATVSGRYYAMDRDNRWERVQKAYDAIVSGEGEAYVSAEGLIEKSYAQDVTDEFVVPAVHEGYAGAVDGDGIIMCNFRADRAREILYGLLDDSFDGFVQDRKAKFAGALGFVEYSSELNNFLQTIFEPVEIKNSLGEYVASLGKKQLRIAETEKYAHVTFFMSGGREAEFDGEERILVKSPDVATYDLKPEMAAPEVAAKMVAEIKAKNHELIIANFANTDMVGHTGVFEAAKAAVEAVDECVGEIAAAAQEAGYYFIVTADHGNAEQMQDADTPHTAHTTNLVPFIIGGLGADVKLGSGALCDIAPTVLELMGLDVPAEMTGKSLISK